MIELGVAEARELAPIECKYHWEAAKGSLCAAADLREFAGAPSVITNILHANAEAAIAVERRGAARLEAAIQRAMKERIGKMFRVDAVTRPTTEAMGSRNAVDPNDMVRTAASAFADVPAIVEAMCRDCWRLED